MLGNIVNNITGENNGTKEKVQGTVVLMKKNVLDFNDFPASLLDDVHELVGQRTYLPSETPMPLRYYREQELGEKYVRQVLGGSAEYPYPRRGRTSRPPAESYPNIEGQMPPLMSLTVYVPKNERFGHLKMSDFLAYALKVVVQFVKPALEAFDSTPNEFDSFEDVLKLFEGGFVMPGSSLLDDIGKNIPFEMLKEILHSDGEKLFEFPTPQVIKGISSNKQARPRIAIEKNKLFILDHHDPLMPQLRRINADTFTNTYTSRTILFLKDDGTLKPLVLIELSSPHPDGDQFGTVSKVYSPSEHGVEGSIWQLAKAYVGVNDSAVHHLISHWLHTHAVIEPFVIATNRQLSTLINAGGLLETTIFPAKYAVELSSVVYKNWVFSEQALPEDLKRRGIAQSKNGLNSNSDEMVRKDAELQSWWKELREEGHGDKKDEPWWPKMQTREELIESCTIIIWVASALHAAVNFGQYPYVGYMPNRPAISHRFMPEKGTPEYSELESDPDKAFFKTIPTLLQTVLMTVLMEILSRHSTDEEYLGQIRNTPEWTFDRAPLQAFVEFGNKLTKIAERIVAMNKDTKLKNHVGPHCCIVQVKVD
ncbi:hypothetical protein EZV62_006776 [Acer yangbiense]|uniref:Lipoxygenase domain-containing protein n=1 Tax=Acer yangbiense TaxID=1000413 RepID=A0A5C7I8P6_9ROSI|nr:hypothetical protein EZV62_006776 [Acer yangbiense]